jgi:hypothetical protein
MFLAADSLTEPFVKWMIDDMRLTAIYHLASDGRVVDSFRFKPNESSRIFVKFLDLIRR